MHHQAGVNFWKFHWSEIPGHFANRDGTPGQRLIRDSPGQTGTYGRSTHRRNNIGNHRTKPH